MKCEFVLGAVRPVGVKGSVCEIVWGATRNARHRDARNFVARDDVLSIEACGAAASRARA